MVELTSDDYQTNVKFAPKLYELALCLFEDVKYSDTDVALRPDEEGMKKEFAKDVFGELEEIFEENETKDRISIGYFDRDNQISKFLVLYYSCVQTSENQFDVHVSDVDLRKEI